MPTRDPISIQLKVGMSSSGGTWATLTAPGFLADLPRVGEAILVGGTHKATVSSVTFVFTLKITDTATVSVSTHNVHCTDVAVSARALIALGFNLVDADPMTVDALLGPKGKK